MNSFEFNKVFAAILLAGLIAMLAGFAAKKFVHPEEVEPRAYAVPGMAAPTTAAAEAPKGPNPIDGLLASADVAAGQKTAKVCAACHSFDQGGPNKVGPNMWNVVGGPKAHMEGFAYSKALAERHGEKWGYAELNQFLYNPKAYVPGTKMVFAGIKNDQERANVIAWLRTLSASPQPLP